MVSAKHLACLLLLIAIAPAASAGGMVMVLVSPIIDPKVGQTVTATRTATARPAPSTATQAAPPFGLLALAALGLVAAWRR